MLRPVSSCRWMISSPGAGATSRGYSLFSPTRSAMPRSCPAPFATAPSPGSARQPSSAGKSTGHRSESGKASTDSCAGTCARRLGSPLDRAADAGSLVGWPLARAGDCDHGLVEVAPRTRHPLAVARIVDAAPVFQFQAGIEAEEIRRADGAIGPRHILAAVDDIGEWQLLHLGKLLHVVEGVCRIGRDIVWHDGDRCDA